MLLLSPLLCCRRRLSHAERSRVVTKATRRLPPLRHAQIISICHLTFGSCSGMLLLSPLLSCSRRSREGYSYGAELGNYQDTRRLPTISVCSNHSNIPFDRCFMFRYAHMIVVVTDCCRPTEKRLAFDHLPASHYALDVLSALQYTQNCSNMSTDL
jgi:hypothetical protein